MPVHRVGFRHHEKSSLFPIVTVRKLGPHGFWIGLGFGLGILGFGEADGTWDDNLPKATVGSRPEGFPELPKAGPGPGWTSTSVSLLTTKATGSQKTRPVQGLVWFCGLLGFALGINRNQDWDRDIRNKETDWSL